MTKQFSEERLAAILRKIPSEYEDIFQTTLRGRDNRARVDRRHGYLELPARPPGGVCRWRISPAGWPTWVGLFGWGDSSSTKHISPTESGMDPAERRSLIIRIAVIAVVAIALFAFLFAGEGDDDNEVAAAEVTPVIEANETPMPEPIQELSGANETLQGIGGLGGTLQLGRPASIELHFSQTGEVIALPIDPSRTTNKGELRYNGGIMAGDNPVAVWLFGTVLNYAIGIPEPMVARFVPGDQIVLQTDTGASYTFLIGSVATYPNYATNELLQQNRVGMTLFSLPAADEGAVPVALASYDIAQETADLQPPNRFDVGTPFTVAGATIEITEVALSQRLDGLLVATLTGRISGELVGKSILMGLTSRAEQTETIKLDLTTGAFRHQFTWPDTVQGAALAADIRVFPGGELATVNLGEVPILQTMLVVTPPTATLDKGSGLVMVAVSITNQHEGTLLVAPEFITLVTSNHQRGDELIEFTLIDTQLPTLMEPGAAMVVAATFMPPTDGSPVLLTLGRTRWELASFS